MVSLAASGSASVSFIRSQDQKAGMRDMNSFPMWPKPTHGIPRVSCPIVVPSWLFPNHDIARYSRHPLRFPVDPPSFPGIEMWTQKRGSFHVHFMSPFIYPPQSLVFVNIDHVKSYLDCYVCVEGPLGMGGCQQRLVSRTTSLCFSSD